jgi:hypothetical protein
MRLKLAKAAAAGLAATVVLSAVQPALAVPALGVIVPCQSPALAAAIAGATSDETLSLAQSCRYVLTVALPAIKDNLTIEGNGAVLERSTATGTPPFAILTVVAGNLAVSQLAFRNGAGGAISYQSGSAAGGSIAVTDDTFAGNAGGAINDDGSPDGALTVTRSAFTTNTGGAINDGDEDAGAGALTVTRSAFTTNTGGAINDFGNNAGNDTVADSTFTGNASGGINYQSYVTSTPSTLMVTKTTFTRNAGSGINCASVVGCTLSVTSSTFTRNTGSGISTGPTIGTDDITVSRSTFTRNTAPQGGAIDLDSFSSGILTATGDTFTGNTATVGGGAIYNFDYVAASGSTFTGNSAPLGGGMENEWQADMTGSAFRKNTAQSEGGGLYNDDQIAVTDTTFRGNAADSGGAIYQVPESLDNYGQDTPMLSLTDSKISGNEAAVDGGGIGNTIVAGYSGPGPGPGTVAVTHSLVADNTAGAHGGGIYDFGGGSVPLTSAVVTGNQPDNCAPANAVPGCTDGPAAASSAREHAPGGRISPRPALPCVVRHLGLRSQLRNQPPRQCGVHYTVFSALSHFRW